jgi:hypothetical protein
VVTPYDGNTFCIVWVCVDHNKYSSKLLLNEYKYKYIYIYIYIYLIYIAFFRQALLYRLIQL